MIGSFQQRTYALGGVLGGVLGGPRRRATQNAHGFGKANNTTRIMRKCFHLAVLLYHRVPRLALRAKRGTQKRKQFLAAAWPAQAAA
jgi:hypothetical protein